ncbi:hypothetical protein GDO86_001148 [Hymenochirus boettgeri]|uniref:Uncharacterized protein n=1 Tax=Hymenochirus boettgeri TaxID=247094 RepID=A0A8T2KKA3_9PIPI|nr:hypothetical protein GDO86_001148 [Hymenochirus boettgeri]
MIQDTTNCNHCHDVKILKEETDLLKKQLAQLEWERENLVASLIEEKRKEAEIMNRNNEIEQRYLQLREKCYKKKLCPPQSHLAPFTKLKSQ